MTRNLILIAINLLIAAAIGGNAIFSLLRGCDFGGRCSGGSSALTWALAIGLPLLVAAGLAVAGAMWWRGSRNRDDRTATISPSTPEIREIGAQESGDTPTQAMIDSAMSARLARTTSAAHVAQAASPSTSAPGTSDIDDRLNADVPQEMVEPMSDMAADVPRKPTGWSLAKSPVDDVPRVDAPACFAVGQRPAATAFPGFSDFSAEDIIDEDDDEDEESPTRPIAWLIDRDSIEPAPQLLLSSGFPWAVAGIDHICIAVARLGTALAGSDFPSEAAAWRQVVNGLPRAQPLAREDAKQFTMWLNAMLGMTDTEGLDMVEDALHELAVEAATNAALSAVLPGEVVSPWDKVRAQEMLRRLK